VSRQVVHLIRQYRGQRVLHEARVANVTAADLELGETRWHHRTREPDHANAGTSQLFGEIRAILPQDACDQRRAHG
jgi:hypothetical protein